MVGLSEAWLVNESIASLLFEPRRLSLGCGRPEVYYNVLSRYPFMSYGENVIVGVQNVVEPWLSRV